MLTAAAVADPASDRTAAGTAEGTDWIRDAIEQVAGLNPCSGTLAAGWSPAKTLQAKGIPECDWVAEVSKMAYEEMARWTGGDSTGQSDVPPDARKLRLLATMLGEARECREVALQTALHIAQNSPEGSEAWRPASGSWILLACSPETPGRFAELGDWYLALRGADSDEFTRFCAELWKRHASCTDAENILKNEIGKYLLASAAKFQDAWNAAQFDVYAVGYTLSNPPISQHYPGLDGWVGSLQRRRLAEKFPNAVVKGTQTLSSRAANELAADEKDLTDLQEMYGPWTTDDGDKEKTPP